MDLRYANENKSGRTSVQGVVRPLFPAKGVLVLEMDLASSSIVTSSPSSSSAMLWRGVLLTLVARDVAALSKALGSKFVDLRETLLSRLVLNERSRFCDNNRKFKVDNKTKSIKL